AGESRRIRAERRRRRAVGRTRTLPARGVVGGACCGQGGGQSRRRRLAAPHRRGGVVPVPAARSAAGGGAGAAAVTAGATAAVVVPRRGARRRYRCRPRATPHAPGGLQEGRRLRLRLFEARHRPGLLCHRRFHLFDRAPPQVDVPADEVVRHDKLVLEPGGRLDPPHRGLVVPLGEGLRVENVLGELTRGLALRVRPLPEELRHLGGVGRRPH
ncbi:unnamed protein product, partial [Ectocarpus sp. 13 AM-2016]